MKFTMSWTEFKNNVLSKGLKGQYLSIDNMYNIYAIERNIAYLCTIYIDEVPNAEQLDFENNYKSAFNVSTDQTTSDGKQYVRSESRPLDYTTFFTMAGDSDTCVGGGKTITWDFSNDEDLIYIDSDHKRKIVEFDFIDGIALKDGLIFYYDAIKNSYIDFYVICKAGNYYYDNNGIPKLAVTDTKVSHYLNRMFIYGSVKDGVHLITECCGCTVPTSYKFCLEITVPISDNSSFGSVLLEVFRKRTTIL